MNEFTNSLTPPINPQAQEPLLNPTNSRKRSRGNDVEVQDDIINSLYEQIMDIATNRITHGWTNPIDDDLRKKFSEMLKIDSNHPKVKELEEHVQKLMQNSKQ